MLRTTNIFELVERRYLEHCDRTGKSAKYAVWFETSDNPRTPWKTVNNVFQNIPNILSSTVESCITYFEMAEVG